MGENSSSENNVDALATDENLHYVGGKASKLKFGELTDDELRVLATINQKIAAAPSLESLIDYLFESSRTVFPCDRIAIAFLEDDDQRLVAHYAVAAYEPMLLTAGYSEDVDGSSLIAVLRDGEPRIINDLEQHLADKPESASTRLLVEEGVRSSMTCPLVLDGRVVGVLFRSSKQKSCYTDRDARKHQAITERLSQAVDKAWRIRQLNEANRAYQELLGFVSHDLRGPLTSMLLDAQISLDDELGTLSDGQRQRLEQLVNKGESLLDMLKDYVDLARLDRKVELTVDQHVDLHRQVIEPALAIVQPKFEARAISFEVHLPREDALVECDPELMTVVLSNLLSNAAKFGAENGHVRVRLRNNERGFELSVWNEGQGFDEADSSRLFRRFSRLPSAGRHPRGTGVGLYTAWRIVHMHGGRINAHSLRGSWAEFTLEIPQPLPIFDREELAAKAG